MPTKDVLDWETAAEILAHWRRLEEERLRRARERLAELGRLQDQLRALEALTALFEHQRVVRSVSRDRASNA